MCIRDRKWLLYFWPIFASSRFIPQSQAEGAGSAKPVMFRKAMATLMAPYQGSGDHGGLTTWQMCIRDRLNPDSELLVVMLAALERQKQSSQWIKNGGEFIPYPTTWLNKRRWEDSVSTAADAQDRPSWALSAGFLSRYEAENAGCRAHNAHLFANGLQKEVA